MTFILRFLETVDLGGLFVLVLALLFVGNKISQGYDRVRAFCIGMSGLLFVVYVGLNIVQNSNYRDDLASLAFRGILGAGLVLGASWIVLTAAAACYEKISGILSRWSAGLGRSFENRKRSRENKMAFFETKSFGFNR